MHNYKNWKYQRTKKCVVKWQNPTFSSPQTAPTKRDSLWFLLEYFPTAFVKDAHKFPDSSRLTDRLVVQ